MITSPGSSDAHSDRACFEQRLGSQKDKRDANLVSSAVPSSPLVR